MSKVLNCLIAAILLSGLLIVGCSDNSSTNGDDDPIVITSGIGPEGGTISISGSVNLVIPAGALSETVDFTIEKANSGPTPPGSMKPVSSFYSIDPSGTDFSIPAILTIYYQESALGGLNEQNVVLQTYENQNWSPLTTIVNAVLNSTTAEVNHLSDFCAMVDSSTITEGVFVKLVVSRGITYISGYPLVIDAIVATFDSTYAPCDPVQPISGLSVSCEQYQLVWDDITSSYMYPESGSMPVTFIQLGGNYEFDVTASGDIPALVSSIDFPSKGPYVTYPTYLEVLSRSSDLTVEWLDSGSGVVELLLVSAMGDSAFMIETGNDGSHTISSTVLSDLQPTEYLLILNHYNRENISAAGYDSRSFIAGRVMSTTMITLE